MAEQIPEIGSDSSLKIIFFDGFCNLCNHSVQLIIKKDRHSVFKFASLQSEFAKKFLGSHGYERKSDSIIYFNGEKFFEKSNAALRIIKHLRFPVPMLLTGWIIPAFIRNAIYDFVAKKRYNWFGRQDSCMIPTPELKSRFLD